MSERYTLGDILASKSGEYWIARQNKRKKMFTKLMPVFMSAGNRGYWVDESREPIAVAFENLQSPEYWFIETDMRIPQHRPAEISEQPARTSNYP
jgi:hypothetical protein